MYVISTLPTCDGEFSVQEIVEASAKVLDSGFGNSHVNQMLGALANAGLVYKNRRGKYFLRCSPYVGIHSPTN